MAQLVYSQYYNSGGSIYVMEGAADNTPLDPNGRVWFFGNMVSCDEPFMEFYKTEEDLDSNSCEFDEDKVIHTAYGYVEDWVTDLWVQAFQYAIEFSKKHGPTWAERIAVEDYKEFLERRSEHGCKN